MVAARGEGVQRVHNTSAWLGTIRCKNCSYNFFNKRSKAARMRPTTENLQRASKCNVRPTRQFCLPVKRTESAGQCPHTRTASTRVLFS